MRLSALTVLNFNSNINYSEIRRRIKAGEPVGQYGANGLVDVPEDVFIMHLESDNNPDFSDASIEPAQINTGNITQRLVNSQGKMRYLWYKISQKSPNTAKATQAFLEYPEIAQLIDITPALQGRTGEISQTINDKIDSAFDKLNDKIKDFSFKELEDLAENIVGDDKEAVHPEMHTHTHFDDDFSPYTDNIDHNIDEHTIAEHTPDEGDTTLTETTPDDTGVFDDSVFDV